MKRVRDKCALGYCTSLAATKTGRSTRKSLISFMVASNELFLVRDNDQLKRI